jgi:uncharacterized protein
MENTIVWADIPVTDLDRAMQFYGRVLQRRFMRVEGMEGIALEAPPEGQEGRPEDEQTQYPVSFDLALMEESKPSTDGCVIYLNSYCDPDGMMQRAVDAGGEVLMPVTDMGGMVGSIGHFKDSEGNRIGVHKAPEM